MKTVRDLMTTTLVTLSEDDDLVNADRLMRTYHLRHVPVVKEGRLVGLITHRDLLRAQLEIVVKLQANDGEQYVALQAGERMTKDVQTVSPDTTAADAVRLLLHHKYGCLPVVNEGLLVGIVTEADFLRWALPRLALEE